MAQTATLTATAAVPACPPLADRGQRWRKSTAWVGSIFLEDNPVLEWFGYGGGVRVRFFRGVT